MITNSLVVIGHRPGNPKGIKDWPDLAKPGVGVLYPDPKTSGGARWNINAIYGSAFLASREPTRAKPDLQAVRDFLTKVQANVVNMDGSGRQSMANFAERGTGDAVVTYENEILLHNKGKRAGKPIPYVIPPATLLIESSGGGRRDLGGIARQPGCGRGVPRVPAFRARAANLRGVRVSAGEGRCGGSPRAPAPRRPSSSRWPTSGAGRSSRASSTGPRGCGRRSSPRRRAPERSGSEASMATAALKSGRRASDLVLRGSTPVVSGAHGRRCRSRP